MSDGAATVTSSAPVFVGGSSNAVNDGIGPNSSPNTVTLTKPVGTVSGNFIIITSACYDTANSTTITWPSGFIENANSMYLSLYGTLKVRFATKIAGSSEPSSYNISSSGSTYQLHIGAIAVYSGVNATTPIEAITATTYNTADGYATGHTVTGVGVSSGTANRVLVQISGLIPDAGSSFTFGAPASYTSRFNYPVTGNAYGVLSLYDYTDSAGTNTSNATSTFTCLGCNTARWAYMLALKPQ
jgi:hypothetical protein